MTLIRILAVGIYLIGPGLKISIVRTCLYAFLNSVKLKLAAREVSAINMYYGYCLYGEVPKK